MSSSSSWQQNFRNFKHLLTICCAWQSLLQPPPLPISQNRKKYRAMSLDMSKDATVLILRIVVGSLASLSLPWHASLIWVLFGFSSKWKYQRCLFFTCFLQPLSLLNPSWLQDWTGRWNRPSQSSSSKWSLFGLGDAFANFDQSTSSSRLLISSTKLSCEIFNVL